MLKIDCYRYTTTALTRNLLTWWKQKSVSSLGFANHRCMKSTYLDRMRVDRKITLMAVDFETKGGLLCNIHATNLGVVN